MRPTWDEQHMEIARVVARRSTCLRVPEGVGAVVVSSKTNRILGTGYAGSLPGQPHCTDVDCWKIGNDPGCHRTIHAEMNALLVGRAFIDYGPKTLYTTLSPCFSCLKHAILMGVIRVVFDKLYRIHEDQARLCAQTNVSWELMPRRSEDE